MSFRRRITLAAAAAVAVAVAIASLATYLLVRQLRGAADRAAGPARRRDAAGLRCPSPTG